jgi:RPA family protein
MSADSGPGNREVARRLFAAEFDDATLSYSESDEERAPNYVVTPTGARVNRLFAVGVLTEVEQVNEDSLRGRVVDPTGAFVTYAGQYQPDEHAFLSRTEPPTFVALSGKARTFEPEDSDRVFTSVRPESLNEVDADTRDRWVVSAAERTLDRIAVFAEALDSDLRGEALSAALEAEGVNPSLAAGVTKAIEHYDTGTAYLEAVRSLAVEAVEQVAGERDAVGALETLPDDPASTDLGPLPDTEVSLEGFESVPATADEPEPESEPSESPEQESESAETDTAEAESEPQPTESEEPADAETESTEDAGEPEESEAAAAPAVEPTATEAESEGETVATDSEPADADEAEPDEESEADEPAAAEEELGDFDTGESVQETVEQEAEELGDFDPSETVDEDTDALTEEERKEVQEEFGTEFATGTEVDDPGEAGIDVPTSEDELEELEDENGDEADEAAEETEAEADELEADVDLESVVVETIGDLDDGDGVDWDKVVAAVADDQGVDADAVDDAIQEAMLSGKCYEPNEGTLKAI